MQNSLDFNRLTVASGRFVAPLHKRIDTRTLEVWIRVTDHLTDSRDAVRADSGVDGNSSLNANS